LNADSATPLLAADDPAAFRRLAATSGAPILVLCDHAANAVPSRLGRLGLSDAELGRHIGLDIGAEAVARGIAAGFGAEAILASYSRLVIDLNRHLDDASLIARRSDGTDVPGNAEITPAERTARIDAIFSPYHDAIATTLDGWIARGQTPTLISIHSFTPTMNGFERPWHIGVLWDRDPRVAVPLLAALRARPGLVVGDNEPYTARGPTDFTMPRHAVARGIPHVMLEIRQNEIDTEASAARYAALLVEALAPIVAPGAA
jgi:predicted N-formylglutamate amidohydrolase